MPTEGFRGSGVVSGIMFGRSSFYSYRRQCFFFSGARRAVTFRFRITLKFGRADSNLLTPKVRQCRMPSVEDLLARAIPELRELFLERNRPVPKGLLEALEVDTRHGAHQLAKRIRARYRSNRAEGQRLHTLLRFEIDLWSRGYSLVAGVDEAGMAPLAGPVVAGAVILPQNYKLRGLNDSKKILDHVTREELAAQIKQDAVCWSFGFAEVEEIDRINIYHAGLLAMQRAVNGLSCLPDFVLVDARKIPHCPAPQPRHHPRRRAFCQHRGGFNNCQDHSRRAHARDGRALSRVWLCVTQGLSNT